MTEQEEEEQQQQEESRILGVGCSGSDQPLQCHQLYLVNGWDPVALRALFRIGGVVYRDWPRPGLCLELSNPRIDGTWENAK